ncbi:M28 family peptidase [Candidatus Halobonum tyrrellensis]|uniref:Carboxypeptidase Q n=1 Tax=Candidatus Halobonum tyrrellensis G22 TaxID=1324957 RepID=V4GTM6_9EURY|nr:M28 family metallopeptidase [Candidatus Halobonum tyrrellensis]ESP88461.1 peptidase M28 [Candidatus Halobonum tyrrellensis G22]
MTTLSPDTVGDAYTSTHSWDLLRDLVDIDNRMAGQEGEAEAAELVREAFEANGLREAQVEEFPIPGWWRGPCSLTVDPGRVHTFDASHEILELPGTPSGEVTAEVVDVGHGLPEDFEDADLEGSIVMASSDTPDDYGRWIHRAEKYGAAAKAGADAFLFRNHIEGCLPPTGSIGDDDGPGPIPAVGVSKEVGDRLVRYCADGTVEADLSVDCRNEPTQSRNVEAVVGPDTDEEVLVTAHVDAHDIAEGANDNGAGTVLVSEVGRLLAGIEDDLETRVRLLVFGAEEVGLFGAYEWVDSHDAEDVKCIVNIDGAGYSRNLDVYTHGFEAIGDAFREASDELAVPISVQSDIRPHSDHWPFVQEGIAGAQARSLSDTSGRGWGHTHGDTLDKLDLRDFRDLAVGLTAGVVKLAEADREVEHASVEAVRDATVEQGYEEGMRNTGGWPFGHLDDDETAGVE